MGNQANRKNKGSSLSEQMLDAVMIASNDAVITYDPSKAITAFSPAAERMFGYSAREAVGRHYGFLLPERLRQTYEDRWDQFATAPGEVYQRTAVDPVIMVAKDGHEFPVELSATKIRVGDRLVLATSMRDLSQAGITADLALSQATLSGIITLSEDAIITVDTEHRITLFNPAAERTFGYMANEVMGRHMELLIPPRLREVHRQHVQDFIELKDVHQVSRAEPILALRKNGQEFPSESTVGKFTLNGEQILTVRLRDISEKLRADAALAMSQGRLEGIVNLSDDAIITVDEAQRITLFNPAAERTFGYEQAEVMGRSIEMLIPQRLHRAHRQHVAGFVQSGDETRQMSLSGPITAVRKSGEEFPAESAVARFTLNGKQILTVRLRDVTEKVRADEMRVKLLAAEEGSRLKMQLISTVSHELRSPLSAILGFTSILIEYDDRLDTGERLEQLRVIEDATRHLQRIVDDLLALSRIEAGVLHLQREPVPLRTLLGSVLATFGAVSTHDIRLVPRETNLVILGDQSRLRQVLSNLIDNAIKYSPPGGEIEIRARKSRDRVTITVRDYGPGVRPDEIEAIFEAFYRSANAIADETIKSTGLGLAICKGFVEAHGGEIRASLPDGGGLAVAMTLPLAETAAVK